MKKYLIGFCFCVFLLSCVNKTKPKVEQHNPVKNNTKVIVHYMGWYSDKNAANKKLRHWEHGAANTPIIGKYNSKSKATLVYHSLLAWSSGIDAIAINIKDKYDYETMVALFKTIDELQSISKNNFNLKYLISYDDQGFDLQEPLDTTFAKMKDFKENITTRTNYLYHKNHPLFFSFDYPKKFLTAKSFRTVIDSVFKKDKPYLIWNTFGEGEEVQPYVNAFYPWVQPGGEWHAEGLNWGKGYLNYFYDQVNKFETKYSFVVGGVWAGFDDRKNTSWGGNRLISRQNGKVYDNTWNYIHNYEGKLPMDYVVLETWNDWNEGTEIEPSIEHGYQYLTQTVKHINQLKGTNLNENSLKFELAKKIHDAIQKNNDSISENLKEIIELFCNRKYKKVQENLN